MRIKNQPAYRSLSRPIFVIAPYLAILCSVYFQNPLEAGVWDWLRGNNNQANENTDTEENNGVPLPSPLTNGGKPTAENFCRPENIFLAAFPFADWINMSRSGRSVMSYTKKYLVNNNLCFVHSDNQKDLNIWVQPYGFHAKYGIKSKKDSLFNLSLNTFGIEGGGDWTLWNHLTLGGVAGYLHSHFETVDINGFYLGPFIGGLFPKGFASFSLIGARNKYNGKIEHYSRNLLLRFEGGYDHQLPESFTKEFYLHPELLIDYLKVFESSHNYAEKHQTSFFRSLTALRASKTMICTGDFLLIPALTFGWVYLKPLSVKVGEVKKHQEDCIVEVEKKSKSQLALGGELTALIKKRITFVLSYEGNFGKSFSVQEGKVRLEWSW